MITYTCTQCNYVYDSEKGDPEHFIEVGRLFEDIPDDWACPECGAQKSDFVPSE